jgi:hypothetical protein
MLFPIAVWPSEGFDTSEIGFRLFSPRKGYIRYQRDMRRDTDCNKIMNDFLNLGVKQKLLNGSK